MIIQRKKGLPARQLLLIARKIFIFLIISISLILVIIPQNTQKNIEMTEYTVSYGDTYWKLARKAQDAGYKKDVRVIVDEMINKSGIMAHELKEGDAIWVHEIKDY